MQADYWLAFFCHKSLCTQLLSDIIKLFQEIFKEVLVMSEKIHLPTGDEYGKVLFADEVIAAIAGKTAREVKGVAEMTGGVFSDITKGLGRKNWTKGVKVQVSEKETSVDLYIIVEYGVKVPEVAWNIQESVKKAIETMTGLTVSEVNIHVQEVKFEKEEVEAENLKNR